MATDQWEWMPLWRVLDRCWSGWHSLTLRRLPLEVQANLFGWAEREGVEVVLDWPGLVWLGFSRRVPLP